MSPKPKYSQEELGNLGLGTKPDTVIAKERGIDRRHICYLRNRLGIPPFVGMILDQEGIPCRSVYEAMYDAYLHSQGKAHEREVWIGKLCADFFVDGQYIEIVGMSGFGKYEQRWQRKLDSYRKYKVTMVNLSKEQVEELYAQSSLPLNFRYGKKCKLCGKENRNLVKGLCRTSCYMKVWRKEQTLRRCRQCDKLFPSANVSAKYCSRKCYWMSLQIVLPSWEWIDGRLEGMSIASLAYELGVKPTTLYMRLRRRRIKNQ